jgi:hypothetical protein
MTKVRTFANGFKDARKLFPKDGWIFCSHYIHKNLQLYLFSFEDISHFIIKSHEILVGFSLLSAIP